MRAKTEVERGRALADQGLGEKGRKILFYGVLRSGQRERLTGRKHRPGSGNANMRFGQSKRVFFAGAERAKAAIEDVALEKR